MELMQTEQEEKEELAWKMEMKMGTERHRWNYSRQHQELKSLVNSFKVCFLILFFVVGIQISAQGRLLSSVPKPDRNDVAAYACWLVSQNSWGVLNTISNKLEGAPFGNVVSFSDGLPNEGSVIPYFYLTTLDPTASNALKDQRSSLTVSEYPLGTCGKRDPENPVCAKITLTGKVCG
ncbi:protein CREG1-like [Mangifera indica]|uniref:protein CREG1-like n=1 Tax=Mangifera indica TaxID=29780 RepID=UPI001CFBE25C|nr:protein CREG1-like [Mangifera indica]